MKPTIWTAAALCLAAALTLAQPPAAPAGKGDVKAKTKAPRPPAQSPASQVVPKTATAQTYSSDLIKTGEARFSGQCGFCHGRDATGGESGPDLTRSELVAEDNRGDKIIPIIRTGRDEMPAFQMSDADLNAIVAFIHDRKTFMESVAGDRRQVDASDLATGNAQAGQRYFNANCATCHSPTKDLAGVATRFQGLALMRRMLYPSGGQRPQRPKVTFTLADGNTLVAPLLGQDEFTVSVADPLGVRQTYEKSKIKFTIENPMDTHYQLLGKYSDKDMHDVYAFLDTLK
jgi:cytochrome c oxidase cbb3-type subunit 3